VTIFLTNSAATANPVKEIRISKKKRQQQEEAIDARRRKDPQPILGKQQSDAWRLREQKKKRRSSHPVRPCLNRQRNLRRPTGQCWISSKNSAGTPSQDDDDGEKTEEDDDLLSLRCWVKTQRINYATWLRRGNDSRRDGVTDDTATLNIERIEMLNHIGFMLEFQSIQWWKTYDELVNFEWQFAIRLSPPYSRRTGP